MRRQTGKILGTSGDGGAIAAVELDGCEMADLVAELLARGASARFVARGGSMSPWIRPGDVVTLAARAPALPGSAAGSERTAGPVRLGDVVAFRRAEFGRLTVHRLVRRAPGGWVARGDRAPFDDGVVPDGEILGIVTRIERNGRTRFLPRGLAGVWLATLSRFVLEFRARGRA